MSELPPGLDWTSVETAFPPFCITVLVTDVSRSKLRDDKEGPVGSLDNVWTAFHCSNGWAHNHRHVTSPPTFWRYLPT